MLKSCANIIVNEIFETLGKSFSGIYKENEEPSIDPLGTPYDMDRISDELSLYKTVFYSAYSFYTVQNNVYNAIVIWLKNNIWWFEVSKTLKKYELFKYQTKCRVSSIWFTELNNLTRIVVLIIKMRRSWDHCFFIIGIPKLVKRHLQTESVPSCGIHS